MPADLAQSRVLLTGATGGIGHAIARTLHARGAHLILSARREAVLSGLTAELGDRAEVIPADLATDGALDGLAQRAAPVDILVANAANPGTGKLQELSPAEIDRAINVNLRAPIRLSRALLDGMMERGSGHIVLVSSLNGKIATPHTSIYCATKFGLRGFGLAMHQELHGTGVGVTTVFPGFVREAGLFVDSGAKLRPGMGTSSPQDVADAIVQGIEKNKAEIDVAPIPMRVGARVFAAVPGLGAALSRRLGGDEIAAAVAEGQRDKR